MNRAVLFDLDGVLVPTEQLKARAHSETVKELGGSAAPALYERVMGQSHEVVQAAFLRAAAIAADPAEYTRMYRRRYAALVAEDLEPNPGAVELVRAVSMQGYALGVVTSSEAKMLDFILARIGLEEFFRVRVSADDVTRNKPAPDAYLIALKKLGVSATDAIAVEDSEAGVQAAHAAGLQVIAVRHSLNARHDLSLARVVVESLADYRAIVEIIDTSFVSKVR